MLLFLPDVREFDLLVVVMLPFIDSNVSSCVFILLLFIGSEDDDVVFTAIALALLSFFRRFRLSWIYDGVVFFRFLWSSTKEGGKWTIRGTQVSNMDFLAHTGTFVQALLERFDFYCLFAMD